MASMPTGQDVADFLGQGDDPSLVALAQAQIGIVTALARSYTRDRGFSFHDGMPAEDLAAVIITATARCAVNPDGDKRLQIGDYSVVPAQFVGWSLPETIVLNRYRKRAA